MFHADTGSLGARPSVVGIQHVYRGEAGRAAGGHGLDPVGRESGREMEWAAGGTGPPSAGLGGAERRAQMRGRDRGKTKKMTIRYGARG